MTGTDWSRFRVETIGYGTFLKRNLIHAELLLEALRRARSSLLEVGIGSGAQSAAISRRVPFVVSVDNDSRILSAARPNVEKYARHLDVVAADGFVLPFRDGCFDVGISQGLMEHFPDPQIAGLIREQLRVCRSLLFSVPSDHYPRQDVGDERLMPPSRWAEIVRGSVPESEYRITSRYYGFDPESWKYSLLARRRLGSFSVLVVIDPR